jgi:hypothetical protein
MDMVAVVNEFVTVNAGPPTFPVKFVVLPDVANPPAPPMPKT